MLAPGRDNSFANARLGDVIQNKWLVWKRGNQFNRGVIARLKRGVSIDGARAELDVLARRINANYPPMLQQAGFANVANLAGGMLRWRVDGGRVDNGIA